MPKTRAQKEEIVSDLSQKLGKTKSAVFTSISGYTMEDANSLRAKGKVQGVETVVAKKTLLSKALNLSGLDVGVEKLQGSILTALSFNDEVSAAKLISNYLKDKESCKIVGGLLEGQFVNADIVKHLATLPGKQELLAKLVGSLNSPVSGFVNALAGNMRNLVYALNAIKESKT
jgi:large subunit ribosomal protein L10